MVGDTPVERAAVALVPFFQGDGADVDAVVIFPRGDGPAGCLSDALRELEGQAKQSLKDVEVVDDAAVVAAAGAAVAGPGFTVAGLLRFTTGGDAFATNVDEEAVHPLLRMDAVLVGGLTLIFPSVYSFHSFASPHALGAEAVLDHLRQRDVTLIFATQPLAAAVAYTKILGSKDGGDESVPNPEGAFVRVTLCV